MSITYTGHLTVQADTVQEYTTLVQRVSENPSMFTNVVTDDANKRLTTDAMLVQDVIE